MLGFICTCAFVRYPTGIDWLWLMLYGCCCCCWTGIYVKLWVFCWFYLGFDDVSRTGRVGVVGYFPRYDSITVWFYSRLCNSFYRFFISALLVFDRCLRESSLVYFAASASLMAMVILFLSPPKVLLTLNALFYVATTSLLRLSCNDLSLSGVGNGANELT